MKVVRTDKQFTKENMSIAFIKEAMAIACAERFVVKYDDNLFTSDISFCGRRSGGSVHPWKEEYLEKGYTKRVDCVYLRVNNGFDSYARIFDNSASLQGFYNESDKTVCQVDVTRWTNLLLENGFLEIIN